MQKKELNSESSESTHLVHQRQVVVIRRHRQHQPVLEVQRNLVRVSVLANQRVQRIAVGHLQTKRAVIPIAKNTKIKSETYPANQTRVWRQRHHSVSRDR